MPNEKHLLVKFYYQELLLLCKSIFYCICNAGIESANISFVQNIFALL